MYVMGDMLMKPTALTALLERRSVVGGEAPGHLEGSGLFKQQLQCTQYHTAKSRKNDMGMNILPILREKKMSLVALSQQAGLNRAALHEQAAGHSTRVDYATLSKVKAALGVTWDELLT